MSNPPPEKHDPASDDEEVANSLTMPDQQSTLQSQTQTSGDGPNGATSSSVTLPDASDPLRQGGGGDSTAGLGMGMGMDDKDPILEAVEARIAQKKEMTLREFLGKMDDYAPIIPDALTSHYLTLAGLPPPPQTPLPLARLLALATQKFIADIAADSYQYARIRQGHSTSNVSAANLAGAAAGGVGVIGAAGTAGNSGAGAGSSAAGAATKQNTLGTARPGYGGGGSGGAGGTGGGGVAGGVGAPGTGGAGAGAGGRTVLTMEDLGMAVGEYGVNVRRGEFYR